VYHVTRLVEAAVVLASRLAGGGGWSWKGLCVTFFGDEYKNYGGECNEEECHDLKENQSCLARTDHKYLLNLHQQKDIKCYLSKVNNLISTIMAPCTAPVSRCASIHNATGHPDNLFDLKFEGFVRECYEVRI